MSIFIVKNEVNNLIYNIKSEFSNLKIKDKIIISIDDVLYSGVILKILDSSKNYDDYVKIVRVFDKNDIKTMKDNEKDAKDALKFAVKTAKELELEMNFVDNYYSFDRKQLVFDFLSENRVDFRELAKKIAAKYKTRIELTQIGVRDKAKKIGGLGPCGLFLCCNTFLTDFNSVSINMAKNQMLALNPSKINGICGRLLCCLSYENSTYSDLKKDLPKIGLIADTPQGMGKVVDVNILKGTYKVDLGEKGIVEFNK